MPWEGRGDKVATCSSEGREELFHTEIFPPSFPEDFRDFRDCGYIYIYINRSALGFESDLPFAQTLRTVTWHCADETRTHASDESTPLLAIDACNDPLEEPS